MFEPERERNGTHKRKFISAVESADRYFHKFGLISFNS